MDREAVEVLKIIRFMTSYSLDDFMLLQKIANFLHTRGEVNGLFYKTYLKSAT